LDTRAAFTPELRPEMLGGIAVLRHKGWVTDTPSFSQPLYQRLDLPPNPRARRVELTLIPYYVFANREPTAMQVWIPYRAR
jgi:DUF1680 family protein